MSANLWQSYSFTIAISAAGTTPGQFLTYDPLLSRVRVDVAQCATVGGVPAPVGSTWTVQRSTDLVRWTTVRGGMAVPVDTDAEPIDDYEFAANLDNQYRVQIYSGTGLVQTFTDHITPIIATGVDRVWWKDLARPFLNRQIIAQDFSDVARSSRATEFEIVGSPTPTVVTDTMSSRRYTLTVLVLGLAAAIEFDTVVSVGGIVFLQAPTGSMVPTGYYAVTGDVTQSRPGRLSTNRFFTLPLTECAPPAADVVGATTTWDAVVAKYATWDAVLADAATWSDMVEQVATVDLVTG